MSILIDKETQFLIQGITGKQGQVTCKSMLEYGSQVVAGVTPGKGGQEVEGVSVYNSVEETKKQHKIDATILYVPPRVAKPAILEAIQNNIQLVVIITENIPVHDMAYCIAQAKET